MSDACRKRFDAVLVWKIDRFGRSLKHLVNALAELAALGVAFIGLRDNDKVTGTMPQSMGHNISIPIGFRFRPGPASWHSIAAEITDWKNPKSPSDQLCFLVRVSEGEKTYLLELPLRALPKWLLTLYLENSSDRIRGHSVDLLLCSSGEATNKKREADPWAMRAEFLRLRQDTKALVDFLNRWGVWGTTGRLSGCREKSPSPPLPPLQFRTRPWMIGLELDPEKIPNVFASPIEDRSEGNYVLPIDIWEFRRRCRDGLKSPAHKWLADVQKFFLVTFRPEYPHFFSFAGNCQEAISTTITLDLLRRVKFRICARLDCPSPFPVKNRHRRRYCRQYCAHIESVRKQRRAAKREAKQSSKGLTHAKT